MTATRSGRDSREGFPAGALWHDRDLHIIFSISVMAIVGVFTVAPSLPSVAAALRISPADVGLLITVFSLPGIFLMPLIGVGADRLGRRKVVGLCLLLFAASGGACLWVRDFHALLVLRFFQGIGAAPLSSLNIAFISDMYDGNRRATAMGYNQSVLSIGAAGLTFVGGGLAALKWYYPFGLAFLGVPVGLLVLLRLKSPASEPLGDFRAYLRGAVQTILNPRIVAIYLLVIFGLIMIWGSYMSYLPVLMALKLEQGPAVIGLVMTTMMVFSAAASSLMGHLARRFAGRTLFVLCFLLYGVALAFIPLVPSAWAMIAPLALFGTAQGIFIPNLQTFLGRYSSRESRGAVMAFYGSAIRIGQSLGPFTMGLLFPVVGVEGIFFVCAGVAAGLVAFAAFGIERS